MLEYFVKLFAGLRDHLDVVINDDGLYEVVCDAG